MSCAGKRRLRVDVRSDYEKENPMTINKEQWKWIREPKNYSITDDKIEIITNPHTDL